MQAKETEDRSKLARNFEPLRRKAEAAERRLRRPLVAVCAIGAALLASSTGARAAQAQASPALGGEPTFAAGEAEQTAAGDEVRGELAVDLRDDASERDVAEIDARYGVRLRPNSAWSWNHDKLEVADVDPARETALVEALSHDPRIESAEPMALYRATFVPNDPLYAKQWHLSRVSAEGAWGYSCGRGVTVAVVDTGIACFDHGPFSRGSDLAGTRCQGGWNFVDDSPEAADDNGHGTHVAGTIAQTTNNGVGTAGLAFCATLMPVKVLTRQGFGTVANVAEGIRLAADEGAQVVNLSLGGPIKSRILEEAVEHAVSKGVVVVAAAGNSGRKVGWPAAYAGVLAVSATDDADQIARFSSRGPEIGLAAPGVAVTQQTVCNGGRDRCEVFGTFNGTSMASPHVAGAAALVEALGVTNAASVRSTLQSSARTAGDAKLYGAGILDARAAVARVHWGHLALRILVLAGIALAMTAEARRKRWILARSPGVVLGVLLAGIGLFPLAPLFDAVGRSGSLRIAAELVMRPLGEWDMVLGGLGLHKWMLLASALPVVSLTALGFRHAGLRPFIGGVALGTCALLLQLTWSGDAAFVGGAFLARMWWLANAVPCFWIARVALRR